MTNWIEMEIRNERLIPKLPQSVQNLIKTEEKQHITLLYGCSDDKEYIMNMI